MTVDDSSIKPARRNRALTTLYLVAGISFVGSVSWVIHRNWLLTEFCQFCFAASVSIWLVVIGWRIWQLSWGAARVSAVAGRKVYSFPRRFGMGTLLVLTLVFGALSAYFRFLEW